MFSFVVSILSFEDARNIHQYLMFSCFLSFLIAGVRALYLSCFKIEKIRNSLKRSWRIVSSGESIGWDPVSGSWAIRDVIGAFAFPAQSIKRGRLSAEDYAELPKMLKVILRGLGLCSVVSFLCIFILLVIGDIVGWEEVDWF
ncbi:hypothetical protein [Pseudomonas sp. R4-34-07]|uniref:hypothetical protein n=1 Tax=Pseudomonas sp. R4-34-07 TaxID=658642 RepID=UPI000F5723C1|nr:hypothetical protein [Pseudomonas sp. R4-34-07]